jgi:hypothetical protein
MCCGIASCVQVSFFDATRSTSSSMRARGVAGTDAGGSGKRGDVMP